MTDAELERQSDGHWVAHVRDDEKRAALVRSLRIVADRIERGDSISDALLAAAHALQAGMEPAGSTAASRVLSAVLQLNERVQQARESGLALLRRGR